MVFASWRQTYQDNNVHKMISTELCCSAVERPTCGFRDMHGSKRTPCHVFFTVLQQHFFCLLFPVFEYPVFLRVCTSRQSRVRTSVLLRNMSDLSLSVRSQALTPQYRCMDERDKRPGGKKGLTCCLPTPRMYCCNIIYIVCTVVLSITALSAHRTMRVENRVTTVHRRSLATPDGPSYVTRHNVLVRTTNNKRVRTQRTLPPKSAWELPMLGLMFGKRYDTITRTINKWLVHFFLFFFFSPSFLLYLSRRRSRGARPRRVPCSQSPSRSSARTSPRATAR